MESAIKIPNEPQDSKGHGFSFDGPSRKLSTVTITQTLVDRLLADYYIPDSWGRELLSSQELMLGMYLLLLLRENLTAGDFNIHSSSFVKHAHSGLRPTTPSTQCS